MDENKKVKDVKTEETNEEKHPVLKGFLKGVGLIGTGVLLKTGFDMIFKD